MRLRTNERDHPVTDKTYRLGVLNGDGIGPEIVPASVRILDAAVAASGSSIAWEELPLGRSAIDTHGTAVPEETLAALAEVDAWLLGRVGCPVEYRWIPWRRLQRWVRSRLRPVPA